jgi:hypothetical protein
MSTTTKHAHRPTIAILLPKIVALLIVPRPVRARVFS